MHQQKTSDIAWLIDESAALGRCARQAWAMVPGWHRGALSAAATLMAINSLSNILQAYLLGTLVDRITNGLRITPRDELLRVAMILLGAMAALYVMRECFNVARRYMVENTCTGLNRDMQLRVVRHIMRYDMQQFTGEKIGALHGKIFRSVDGLIHFVRLMFLDFLPAILTGAFALSAALLKQPMIGLIMIGVVPLSVFLTLRQLKSQKGVRLQLMRDCEQVDGLVVEQLSGVEYIRVADTAEREMSRLGEVTERRRNRELKHHFEMSLFGSGKALNEGFFHVCVLALAIYLAIDGKITVGDIFMFSALFGSVMSPLNEIHRVIDLGHESSLRMYDLQELLQRPVDRSFAAQPADGEVSHAASHTPPAPMLASADGFAAAGRPIIEVENLSAEYSLGERRWRPVLHGVSFSIRPGECIGVAGPSGGGKSSMVKVLLRLLHPTGGRASVCGVDLESLDRRSIAEYIGYVGQNPFVFAGTIRDNIAYGCDDADQASVERAAKAAHIHDEILQMDGGYDAAVSERGNNLSGGQRQRVAIARLLLRSTPILILDEATSALDNISERFIQSAIGIRSGKQTVLMIAHRLTTLRHCDKILVFDQGRIVESGVYRELSTGEGKFAELLRASESEHHAEAVAPTG